MDMDWGNLWVGLDRTELLDIACVYVSVCLSVTIYSVLHRNG